VLRDVVSWQLGVDGRTVAPPVVVQRFARLVLPQAVGSQIFDQTVAHPVFGHLVVAERFFDRLLGQWARLRGGSLGPRYCWSQSYGLAPHAYGVVISPDLPIRFLGSYGPVTHAYGVVIPCDLSIARPESLPLLSYLSVTWNVAWCVRRRQILVTSESIRLPP